MNHVKMFIHISYTTLTRDVADLYAQLPEGGVRINRYIPSVRDITNWFLLGTGQMPHPVGVVNRRGG